MLAGTRILSRISLCRVAPTVTATSTFKGTVQIRHLSDTKSLCFQQTLIGLARKNVVVPPLAESLSEGDIKHASSKPKAETEAHDKLWKAERYLSLGLLGVLPAAAAIPHPIMDYAVALSLVVHVHWGVEAIVTDYVRPSIFGATIPKISIALVYVLSSLALGGLFMFNYTDIGITQAVRMLAKI